jgi:hypothetical protein
MCAQVEEYFTEAIKERMHEEDADFNPVAKKENGFKKETTTIEDGMLKERDYFSSKIMKLVRA